MRESAATTHQQIITPRYRPRTVLAPAVDANALLVDTRDWAVELDRRACQHRTLDAERRRFRDVSSFARNEHEALLSSRVDDESADRAVCCRVRHQARLPDCRPVQRRTVQTG